MAHLDLDFVRTSARWPWLGVCLALLALFALGWVWQHGSTLGQQIHQLDTQLEHSRQQVRERNKPVAAEDPQQLAAAFALRRQWRTDWNVLFEALEQAQFKGIALQQIAPDAAKSQLKLAGEALSEADLHDYLRRLQQTGRLREAVLSQSGIDETQPHKPIQFQIQAEWVQP